MLSLMLWIVLAIIAVFAAVVYMRPDKQVWYRTSDYSFIDGPTPQLIAGGNVKFMGLFESLPKCEADIDKHPELVAYTYDSNTKRCYGLLAVPEPDPARFYSGQKISTFSATLSRRLGMETAAK